MNPATKIHLHAACDCLADMNKFLQKAIGTEKTGIKDATTPLVIGLKQIRNQLGPIEKELRELIAKNMGTP